MHAVIGTTNAGRQGVFPTLLFYLPLKTDNFILGSHFNHVFSKSRDFYPLYVCRAPEPAIYLRFF